MHDKGVRGNIGYILPTMIKVCTKYGEPWLYGKGETDLIMVTWHC